MLFAVHDESNYKKSEYRIFKQHMYGGPKGLGDPNYRELSKMEEDPLIPQRMRDITRTQLCVPEVEKYPGFMAQQILSLLGSHLSL